MSTAMKVEAASDLAFYPVALEEAKARLRIEADDRDADLMAQLAMAAEDIGSRLDASLTRRTWRGFLDAWPVDGRGCPKREILLPFAPAISLTHVKTWDADGAETVMDADDYLFSPSRLGGPGRPTSGRIVLADGASWPSLERPVDAIEIEWVAGFESQAQIPERARAAILLLVGYQFDEDRAEDEPAAINNLLRNLRGWGF